MIKTQKELYENLKSIRENEALSKYLEEIFQILHNKFSDITTEGKKILDIE